MCLPNRMWMRTKHQVVWQVEVPGVCAGGKRLFWEAWQNHPVWGARWQRNWRVHWGGQGILAQNSLDISRKYFCRQEPANYDL